MMVTPRVVKRKQGIGGESRLMRSEELRLWIWGSPVRAGEAVPDLLNIFISLYVEHGSARNHWFPSACLKCATRRRYRRVVRDPTAVKKRAPPRNLRAAIARAISARPAQAF